MASAILIGLFVPKSPDTLNPNGDAIIHLLGLLTEPANSCGTGPLQGALHHKSVSRCEAVGGAGGFASFPPHPPFAPLKGVSGGHVGASVNLLPYFDVGNLIRLL